MRSILIAGYPYVKENYLKTFDYYPEGDSVFFLLPKTWKAKNGKLNFNPPRRDNIYTANAYFFHSNYLVIGGLLKGWMSSFPLVLFKIRRKIDIVYSPSEPILLTTFYQGFWTKFFGKQHIIFTWENIPYENKFGGLNLLLKRIIIKLNLLLSDGIVCGNRKAGNMFKQLTKKPIAVIPLSGVDEDFFHKVSAVDFLETHNLKDKLIFSFAGAIGYRKGIHNMVNAFKKVLPVLPNAHLVIAGTGEYEESLRSEVKSLKLENAVTFIPWLNPDGLRELLSASHIFLYPSISHGGWEEQFGYSMAEASLMELPVISTKTGSVDEVVIDGETGILVEPDDEEQLTEAMLKLGTDDALRLRLGKAGNKYISSNFSYSIVADKFYNFFKRI